MRPPSPARHISCSVQAQTKIYSLVSQRGDNMELGLVTIGGVIFVAVVVGIHIIWKERRA